MRLRIVKHLRLPYPSSTTCPARGTACNALRYAYVRYIDTHTHIHMYAFCIQAVTRESVTSRERAHYARDSFRTLMHPISASPKSVKAPPEDAFPLETFFPHSHSKRRPPHVRIAKCPSVRPQVDARRLLGV